jgi:hypothetical protein
VLRQLSHGEPLTESQIAIVLREVLHGLHYLHANRKLHRDVKGIFLALFMCTHLSLCLFPRVWFECVRVCVCLFVCVDLRDRMPTPPCPACARCHQCVVRVGLGRLGGRSALSV